MPPIVIYILCDKISFGFEKEVVSGLTEFLMETVPCHASVGPFGSFLDMIKEWPFLCSRIQVHDIIWFTAAWSAFLRADGPNLGLRHSITRFSSFNIYFHLSSIGREEKNGGYNFSSYSDDRPNLELRHCITRFSHFSSPSFCSFQLF